MAEHASRQISGLEATPSILPGTNERHGRLRVAYWSFTTPEGGMAIGDTMRLVRLPRGARILGGTFTAEAMTTGAGTATVSIGTAADADRYLEPTAVDAVTAGTVADSAARSFGEELAEETDVVATAQLEAWAGAKAFDGVIFYALD